jgi:hypothetical protein
VFTPDDVSSHNSRCANAGAQRHQDDVIAVASRAGVSFAKKRHSSVVFECQP